MTATEPLPLTPLVHDLAIVLRGSLNETAQIGPAPRLAARRLADVLRVGPGTMTRDIEDVLTAAVTAAVYHAVSGDGLEPLATTHQGRAIDARDNIPAGEKS